MLVISAFTVALAVLSVAFSLLFAVRREMRVAAVQSSQVQSSDVQAVTFKHTLTVTSDLAKLQGLLEQLNSKGIHYTVFMQSGCNPTVTFKAPEKLLNISELKRKGVIVEAKIEEEKNV